MCLRGRERERQRKRARVHSYCNYNTLSSSFNICICSDRKRSMRSWIVNWWKRGREITKRESNCVLIAYSHMLQSCSPANLYLLQFCGRVTAPCSACDLLSAAAFFFRFAVLPTYNDVHWPQDQNQDGGSGDMDSLFFNNVMRGIWMQTYTCEYLAGGVRSWKKTISNILSCHWTHLIVCVKWEYRAIVITLSQFFSEIVVADRRHTL